MDAGRTAEDYMRYCLTLAAEALEFGEFPIGAIVVLDDEIVGQGTATEQRERRFLGHAELLALEQADRRQLSFDERSRARLFTTLEPCLMCMGAAMSFFLGEIVYGLESPGDGGAFRGRFFLCPPAWRLIARLIEPQARSSGLNQGSLAT